MKLYQVVFKFLDNDAGRTLLGSSSVEINALSEGHARDIAQRMFSHLSIPVHDFDTMLLAYTISGIK